MRRKSLYAIAPVIAVALGASACSPAQQDELPEAETSAPVSVSTTTAKPETETETVTKGASPVAPAAGQAEGQTGGQAGGANYTIEDRRVPQAQGTDLTIADVRAGSHDGYDRVVFEFTGTGSPGFITGYTPEPLQQASGLPMDVAGNAYLELMIQGTPMASLSSREDLIKAGPMDIGAGNVGGITHGGVFEADTQYIIGLDTQRPYNVYALQNPIRLVVDIQQ